MVGPLTSGTVERSTDMSAMSQWNDVVLTGDQDWAPEWAMDSALSLISAMNVPYHLFRTNQSKVFEKYQKANELLTEGWHPNFLAGSTHGDSIQAVISEMVRLVPNSRTVRTHSYVESTQIWAEIQKTKVVAESNCLTHRQRGLEPIRMWSGLMRFPVFFEDDVFFGEKNSWSRVDDVFESLKEPGLKILNFHPIHLALNTTSDEHYQNWKQSQSPSETVAERQTEAMGIRDLFEQIIKFCMSHKIVITSFENLIDRLHPENNVSTK